VRDEEIDDLLNKTAPDPLDPGPELLDRIAASIQTSLRPVHPLPPLWILTGGLILICAAVAVGGAARAGFLGIEKMDLVQRLLIFPALLALASILASRFVHEMVPGSLRRVSAGALLALGCAALLALFAPLFRDYHTDHFFSVGFACLVTGFEHAVPAGLLCWLLLRRGFAVRSASAGLIAGALGGLAGLGVLELQCPNFQASHVLVWHLAVVPLSSAAGALVGWLAGRLTRSARS
jgi:Negative regulator of sigma F